MRQASLKLKSYAGNISIVNNSDLQKKILRTILVTFGLLSICYILIIGSVTFNIIERKTLDTQARNLGSEVGEMELAYLSKSNAIDLSLSQSLGYKEVKANYVTRKSITRVGVSGSNGNLALAKNEI